HGNVRHQSGVKPDFGKTTLGETLPDPCSVLTDKIVRMKEERVNQTAHMILAQALGVQLKAPSCDDKNRAEQNIHGEYEPIPGRNPVDFIVLEDLSRYTTDKSRARAENSRLMKWCHRAINEKVKMLAEPFGIPVVEVFASFTSKFDAMTGAPGFRASEISLKERSRWAKAIEREPHMAKLFHQLDEALQLGVKNPRLLAPQQLGEFFVAAKHVKIGDDRKMLPKIRQADINAAVNIGLRAIGSPNCFHAHPRVRIEREVPKSKKSKKSVVSTSNVAGPSKWITRRENKREKAQFESATEVSFKKLSVESTLLKEGKATLMHDPLGIASFGHAMIREHDHPRLAHNAAIFSRRKNELGQCTGAIARLEWGVCEAINAYRMKAWREKASGGFHKDEIPFD
ncbi:MAG: type V CRISPR-associated protein Cas12b, partial [Verrucomicrobiales bacterium]|nr:type V CRISPR-associated protein Cas12b [Verrucomicrobiales bacterium]